MTNFLISRIPFQLGLDASKSSKFETHVAVESLFFVKKRVCVPLLVLSEK